MRGKYAPVSLPLLHSYKLYISGIKFEFFNSNLAQNLQKLSKKYNNGPYVFDQDQMDQTLCYNYGAIDYNFSSRL